MLRQFHTPEGIIWRELTPKELEKWAEFDMVARRELYAAKLAAAASPGHLQEKLDIIAEFLGLSEPE